MPDSRRGGWGLFRGSARKKGNYRSSHMWLRLPRPRLGTSAKSSDLCIPECDTGTLVKVAYSFTLTGDEISRPAAPWAQPLSTRGKGADGPKFESEEFARSPRKWMQSFTISVNCFSKTFTFSTYRALCDITILLSLAMGRVWDQQCRDRALQPSSGRDSAIEGFVQAPSGCRCLHCREYGLLKLVMFYIHYRTRIHDVSTQSSQNCE